MRIAVVVGALLVAARPAAACYPAFTRAIVGAPVLEPQAVVSITNDSVEVACDDHYTCIVASTFSIAVTEPARVSVTGYGADIALRVQRSPLAVIGETPAAAPAPGRTATQLAPGKTATVDVVPGDTELTLHARAELPEYLDDCFRDGVIARHPYFASAPAGNQRVLQIDTTATPRVQQPASWDLVVDTRGATKYDPPTTRLWFTVPGRVVTHGGPFALVGAASGAGNIVRLRAGWELAVGRPWLVLALAGETDFEDAWNVALTAEPTTRAWVLPVSLGAGGGVVLANGSRIGGRGQLSIALGPARVVLALDVIDAAGDDGTALTVTGLVGGSL